MSVLKATMREGDRLEIKQTVLVRGRRLQRADVTCFVRCVALNSDEASFEVETPSIGTTLELEQVRL